MPIQEEYFAGNPEVSISLHKQTNK